MRTLTPRRAEILRAIWAYRDRYGYSPTMQELGEQLGLTRVSVFEHITALVEMRYVARRAMNVPRGIVPLKRCDALGETLAGLGVGKVLDAIGKEACLRHFGIVEAKGERKCG